MARNSSDHRLILSAENKTRLAIGQLRRDLQGIDQQARYTSDSMRNLFGGLSPSQLMGGIGLGEMVRQALAVADGYTKLNDKIKLGNNTINEATASEAKLLEVREKLFKISNDTFSSLDTNASAYQKLSFAVKRLGKDSDDTLGIIKQVNQALQISNATTQEAESTRIQFSQALASNNFAGDEFKSVIENAPRLAKAIADGMGKSLGELRQLSKEGVLTADLITTALSSQAGKLDKEFGRLSLTMDRAKTQLKNNLQDAIGKLDSSYGVTDKIAHSIQFLATHLDDAARAGIALSSVFAVRLSASLASYVVQQRAALSMQLQLINAERTAAAQAFTTAKARQVAAAAAVAQAQAAVTAAVGLKRLDVVQSTLLPAQNKLASATEALTVAQTRLSASGRAASAVMLGLNGALGLVGGPLGALVITFTALVAYLPKLQKANAEEGKSIQLTTGEYVRYADITQKLLELNDEYINATEARREEIEKETKGIKDNTQAALDNLKTKLKGLEAKLPDLKLNHSAEILADDGTWQKSIYATTLEAVDASRREIAKLEDELYNAGKAVEANAAKAKLGANELKGHTAAVKDANNALSGNAQQLLASAEASKKAAAAQIEQLNATKEVTDALERKTLALKHGELALSYYDKRVKGLSEDLARNLTEEERYAKFLEERDKLDKKLNNTNPEGIRDQFKTELEVSGIIQKADAYQEAEKAAQAAIKRNADYKTSIEALQKTVDAAATQATQSLNDIQRNAYDVQKGATAQPARQLKDATGGYSGYIANASQQYGVDAALIRAVIQQESSGNSQALSKAGARGLMQIMPATAGDLGLSANELFDAEKNIMAGAKYLSQLLARYQGDKTKAIAAYNGGMGNVDKYGGVPPFKETVDYVQKVTAYYAQFKGTATEVATEVAKTATETRKTADAAESLPVATNQATEFAKKYGSELGKHQVTQEEINQLLDDQVKTAADGLVRAAEQRNQQAMLSEKAYRTVELINKQLDEGGRNQVLDAEHAVKLTESRKALEEEAQQVAADGNDRLLYQQAQMKDGWLDMAEVLFNVNKKSLIEFQRVAQGLRDEMAQVQANGDERLLYDHALKKEGWLNSTQRAVVMGQKAAIEIKRAMQDLQNEYDQTLANGNERLLYDMELKQKNWLQGHDRIRALDKKAQIEQLKIDQSLEYERAQVRANGNQRELYALEERKKGWLSLAQVQSYATSKLALDYQRGLQEIEKRIARVGLSEDATQQLDLKDTGYNTAQQQALLQGDRRIAQLTEEVRLKKEALAISFDGDQKRAYEQSLRDTGRFNEADIKTNSAKFSENVFNQRKNALTDERQQLILSAQALQLYQAGLEGVTDPQQQFLKGLLDTSERMQEVSKFNGDLAAAFQNDMQNALETGKLSFSDFTKTIINEMMRISVYKPILDSLFGQQNQSGGRTGGLLGGVLNGIAGTSGSGGLLSLFGSANGGVMSSLGALPLHKYATGGIAKSPQLAIFGEGRMNEAFVPLPDGRSIPVSLPENVTNRSVSIHYNPMIQAQSGADMGQIQRVLAESQRDFAEKIPALMNKALNRGGSTSRVAGVRR